MKTSTLGLFTACFSARLIPPVRLLLSLCSLLLYSAFAAAQPDPFAANNTLYPPPGDLPLGWNQGFRTSNYDYPSGPVEPTWRAGGPSQLPRTGLSKATAPAYAEALKKFIEADMQGLVNTPLTWSPEQAGWYDMPWGGQGTRTATGEIDPESGREALLGSYTGQILQTNTFQSPPPAVAFQNHAVIYYNDVAASMLGKVWKNPFEADVNAAQFPEGSIVVKVEAATLTPKQWAPLTGSTVSYVYRPTTASLEDKNIVEKKAEIVPMYFSQMAVKVKDSVASPDTGWVFIAFTYDRTTPGATVWDKAIPVGAMWGNDPEYAHNHDGRSSKGEPLQQTWISDDAPPFALEALGWGGRLSGPMDVGRRHNVVTVSGKRYQDGTAFPASSCLSCHSSAQYPFVANLYPSPNMAFPEDGTQFLFYDPGSAQWARWFQNRPGNVSLSGHGHSGIVATDYDMLLTFALGTANGAVGADAFLQHKMPGH
jgi:hypothetical protein